MTEVELLALLRARKHGLEPLWLDRMLARVASERAAVEALVQQSPPPRVYGFTTLLGPLDDQALHPDDQERLLVGHLVGRPVAAPGSLLRDVGLAKIFQVANGGTGITPATVARVAERSQLDHPVVGAWWDSYSSADVVPAAWWVSALLDIDEVRALPPGDLIALLNGTFFSTGAAVHLLGPLVRTLAGVLVRSAVLSPVPTELVGQEVAEALAPVHRPMAPAPVQRPVSLRDVAPVWLGAQHAVGAVCDGIQGRLVRRSGNPLFRFDGAIATACSQSSFLDVTLPAQLAAATLELRFALVALQRWVVELAECGLRAAPAEPALVQRPKIARAILAEALGEAVAAPLHPLCESGGVEDLADGSLFMVRTLAAVVRHGDTMLSLFDELHQLTGGDVGRLAAPLERVAAWLLPDWLGGGAAALVLEDAGKA